MESEREPTGEVIDAMEQPLSDEDGFEEKTDETREPESDTPTSALTDIEAAIIGLEKRRWKYPGAKEQAIRQQLSLSPIAYYQLLNTMIDTPRVIAVEPALTRRLREHRDNG
ncbi:DUF3263 domain-containing protein [Rothia sp. ZJ932]|uniref:DUF3263 domain-containing protein n=1 Tax=Rothia sp. ZJ932 TaxID=2810516 RepID=UPI001967C623|nr:DUF3263 domain-containing protein [Rothia sp. ZJ932]QRZ61902.1 DUF3263 domain-containing protein [Rothia sp. ZJ932]